MAKKLFSAKHHANGITVIYTALIKESMFSQKLKLRIGVRERSQLLRFTPTSFWVFLPCKAEACPLPTEIELQLQKETLDSVIVYEGPLNADFKNRKIIFSS